jgi:SNF2 family DNA or RNA helicase
MELFEHQKEGSRILAENGRYILADDMGLGKTACSLEATRL